MAKTNMNIRPEDVPKSFAVCFNKQCPQRKECARFAAGPAVATTKEQGPCVYPSTLTEKGCPRFHQLRIVNLAWGFKTLFHKVRHEDYERLRWQVIDYFSSESDFFRYNRGHYKLIPERQEEILDIFRRNGYDTSDMRFAHYSEQIDFVE